MIDCSGQGSPGDAASWSVLIGLWLLALRAGGRRPETLALRRYQLGRVAAGVCPLLPGEVTQGDLIGWLGSRGWGRESLRSYRTALRSFYGWAHAGGYVPADPARALPTVKPADPNPRPAPEDAYRLALAKSGDRVRMMLRLAGELGLRRGEVARCRGDHVERDLAGWSLRVVGKGGRLRRIPITDSLASAIRRTAPDGGFLFDGKDEGHLSPRWVGRLVARALPEAWTMHKLRHRFATAAYAVDRDLLTVQQLLGHGSPVTTQIYVKLPDDAARRTVATVGDLV